MPTINPALLYGGNAEEALDYYVSIFDDAEVTDLNRYGQGGPMPAGTMLAATLRLHGLDLLMINGYDAGFTDSVSFVVSCHGQEEVDRYWDALTRDGGQESRCGWLKDRFGMSWQVTPKQMGALIGDPDPVRAQAAMGVMMTQRKIVLADIEAAADAASAASAATGGSGASS